MMHIKNAKNIDDLRECIAEIEYDKWEEMGWTMDQAKMNRVRNYFAFKCMSMGIKTSEVSNGR
jgi:hypothetical protein